MLTVPKQIYKRFSRWMLTFLSQHDMTNLEILNADASILMYTWLYVIKSLYSCYVLKHQCIVILPFYSAFLITLLCIIKFSKGQYGVRWLLDRYICFISERLIISTFLHCFTHLLSCYPPMLFTCFICISFYLYTSKLVMRFLSFIPFIDPGVSCL